MRRKIEPDLLSLVSHELRTPLARLRWTTEMLLAPDADPLTEAQRASLGDLLTGLDRLSTTVDVLLEGAAVALHVEEPERVRMSLTYLLNHVLKEHLPKSRTVRVARRLAPGVPAVAADPKGIETALRLLLDAVVASYRGEIVIRLGVGGNEVVCMISEGRDPGPRFLRTFRKTRQDGTMEAHPILDSHRLALYVARTLIRASGGRTRIGTAEGGAVEIAFSLPRATA